jgi:hypothetical protein
LPPKPFEEMDDEEFIEWKIATGSLYRVAQQKRRLLVSSRNNLRLPRHVAPRIAPNECLFCPATHADMETCLAHMQKAHSFAIPYVQHCEDCEGAQCDATRPVISAALNYFPRSSQLSVGKNSNRRNVHPGSFLSPSHATSHSFSLSPMSVQQRLWLSGCRPRAHAGQKSCNFRR